MKVLHAIKLAGIAGAETYLLNILPELQKKGVDCTFLALINPAFAKEAAVMVDLMRERGIKVIELQVNKDYSPRLFRSIAQVIREGNYDFVHVHLVHAEFYLTMVKRFFIKDLIIASTKHGYNPTYQTKYGFEAKRKYSDPFWWITKLNSGLVNRYCCISFGLKNLLVALNIAKAENIDVIHYGFDYGTVCYDVEVHKYRKAPKQILIVGRLIPVKGHIYAFRALKDILKKHPDTKMVLIGTGDFESQLRKYVNDLGLEDFVLFEGFQMNVHNYIKNSDLVLIPSLAEGFCAVVLEAYHNETPVMAFDVPALNEIIFHNETGIIVKKIDHEDLVQQITNILEQPEKARELTSNGLKKLQTYFTIDRMVDQTIDFYRKTLAS
jgi:glycosyltransferase involved in cell wall biosynthesis